MAVVWPIIVLSRANNFLHLAKDLGSFQEHLFGHAQRNESVGMLLEYFGSDCRLLRPELGLDFLPISFQDTGFTLDEDLLLDRIKAVVERGVDHDAGAHALPQIQATSVKDYVTALLNAPAYAGQPGTAEVDIFGRGGWLHNAIHAAFGN